MARQAKENLLKHKEAQKQLRTSRESFAESRDKLEAKEKEIKELQSKLDTNSLSIQNQNSLDTNPLEQIKQHDSILVSNVDQDSVLDIKKQQDSVLDIRKEQDSILDDKPSTSSLQ